MNRGNRGNRGARGGQRDGGGARGGGQRRPRGGIHRVFRARSNTLIRRATELANDYNAEVATLIRLDDPPMAPREYGNPSAQEVFERFGYVPAAQDPETMLERATQEPMPNVYNQDELTALYAQAMQITHKIDDEIERRNGP